MELQTTEKLYKLRLAPQHIHPKPENQLHQDLFHHLMEK